ncbi:MAG: hypothetical protein IH953_08355 [Chloroflexi bacterium]|nr:hypothetical protein [Chloroflexota bacterium]
MGVRAGVVANEPRKIVVAPLFKMAVIIILILTLFSGLVSIYLATTLDPSDSTDRLIETFTTTWKMGFATLAGLIGGKAL